MVRPRVRLSRWTLLLLLLLVLALPAAAQEPASPQLHHGRLPLVVNTWPFVGATQHGWQILQRRLSASSNTSALDAVEAGCSYCEAHQCDGSVGFGGSPDEAGETTLDALILCGRTRRAGAVGALRGVRGAISVARAVLERTEHTLLVGSQATEFAIAMGFESQGLDTSASRRMHQQWVAGGCQPNFWRPGSVEPDPRLVCGPYAPADKPAAQALKASGASGPAAAKADGADGDAAEALRAAVWPRGQLPGVKEGLGGSPAGNEAGGSSLGPSRISRRSHDTIAMAALDGRGHIAAGTSTNGAAHKLPGRVGDGPIPGSSAYAIDGVGACGATGDGDVMMRFLPCYQAVESMRQGMDPLTAARDALGRIAALYPDFKGGLFAVDASGRHAGAAHGWDFEYAVASPAGTADDEGRVEVFAVAPLA